MTFQHIPIAFHEVIKQMIEIILILESERSESSKATLSWLSTLCHAQMQLHPGYPEVYQPLMEALQVIDTPLEEDIQLLLKEYNWVSGVRETVSVILPLPSKSNSQSLLPYQPQVAYAKRQPGQKIGLSNLGNTCYMNSVIQALFMTDDFRHRVLQSSGKKKQNLLLNLQHLFALLCFSHRHHIAPKIFHDKSRPPWFSTGMQQDCSEYFRHLLITLHEEERAEQQLPEYQERMIIESETTSVASDVQPLPDDTAFGGQMEDDISGNGIGEGYKEGSNSFGTVTDYIQVLNDSINEQADLKLDNLPLPNVKGNCSSLESTAKRKYVTTSPTECNSSSICKSPKGDKLNSAEVDSNSDSGISGDLAEETEQATSGHIQVKYNTAIDECEYFVSQVHNVFGGKLSTCIKCLTCKTESIHRDVFTDINLTFQDSDHNNFGRTRKQPTRLCKTKQSSETSCDLRIEDMIGSYLTPERLTGENQYECDRCNGKQDAEKWIQIIESPEHLILTQLRFYYDTTRAQRQKVFTNVEFGEELLLPIHYSTTSPVNETSDASNNTELDRPYYSTSSPSSSLKETTNLSSCELNSLDSSHGAVLSQNDVLYDRYVLYGVVVHSGFSSEGGHYYCYARNSCVAALSDAEKQKYGDLAHWYSFNDERVAETNFTNISKLTRTFTRDTAYMLFYRKISSLCDVIKCPIEDTLQQLPLELQLVVERDNLLYQAEQDRDRRRSTYSCGGGSRPPNDDEEGPPSGGGGSGGGCGRGNDFNVTSRIIY